MWRFRTSSLLVTPIVLGITGVPGAAQTPPDAVVRIQAEPGGASKHNSNIRPVDEIVARIVESGQRRSPTFRALAEAIERSDVIIYVYRSVQPRHEVAGRVAAGIAFMCASPEARFLRVTLAAGNHRDTQIEALGHEFQHVLEVAHASEVRSREEFRALYKHIGMSTRGPGTHETRAAIRVGELIWAELHGASRKSAALDTAAQPHRAHAGGQWPPTPTGQRPSASTPDP